MADFWRIRMKVGGQYEHSTDAWDRDEVGGWYGAWSAAEWISACQEQPSNPWTVLRELPHQQDLNWDFTPDIAAVRRLAAITSNDWVVVFLRNRGQIGMARLDGGLQSASDHPLNRTYDDGSYETFKFRRISNKKVFNISELPDAYRLLPAQGRGNLHQFHGMRGHVQLLADHPNAQSIKQSLNAMKFDQLIDILGASAWESVCTAYLTLEEQFVPTGLKTGLTLPVFDIVGRSMKTGLHIVAQCKKNPVPVNISDDFLAAMGHHSHNTRAYYFAFGGVIGAAPASITVISKNEILSWVQTTIGKKYMEYLVGI